DVGGGEEGAAGGGHAAVDGALQEDLLDLGGRHAVAQGSSHVEGEFLGSVQGDEERQGEAAAETAVQTRAAPDLSPGVPGDEVVELGGEGGLCRGALHVGVTEDDPAQRLAARRDAAAAAVALQV